MTSDTTSDPRLQRLKAWLQSPVTVTLPGWGVAAVATAGIVLVLLALD